LSSIKPDRIKSLRDYFKLENAIISQNSSWKKMFDTAILFVIGYSCIITTFQVAFSYKPEDGSVMKTLDWFCIGCFILDFIFKFFEEYQDRETFQKIRDHKKIAVRYFKSFWLVLDFLATFPFDAFAPDMIITRMIRLLRLSKLFTLLDVSRIKRMVKSYFENSTRSDRH
jgi:hypothetical protein